MKFKFNFPKLKKRKKLRATAVRRPLRAATADYEELAEPNMKLSRALLIVLVLHVVAVSGIIAFNAIKTRERPVVSLESAAPAPRSTAKPEEAPSPTVEVRRAHAAAKSTDEAHKSYVVAKGDSPVSISKKFKVPYDELIALNHIDDPHKLKVGQKLLIPNKAAPKAKKTNE